MVNTQDIAYLLYEFRRGRSFFPNFVAPKSQLKGALLPFINLRESNLSQSDFRHGTLPGAEFCGAMLDRTNFEHANLLGADLSFANLQYANLDYALLALANLKGAYLRGASLAGARLADVDLQRADLRNANLTGAYLKNANLAEANLFGARISPNALREANLDATVMPDGSHCTRAQESSFDHCVLPQNLKQLLSQDKAASSGKNSRQAAKKRQGSTLTKLQQREFLDELMTIETLETGRSNPDSSTRKKYVGFKLNQLSGVLTLEILDDISKQDGSFICVNHLL
jgi:hypothetical protein